MSRRSERASERGSRRRRQWINSHQLEEGSNTRLLLAAGCWLLLWNLSPDRWMGIDVILSLRLVSSSIFLLLFLRLIDFFFFKYVYRRVAAAAAAPLLLSARMEMPFFLLFFFAVDLIEVVRAVYSRPTTVRRLPSSLTLFFFPCSGKLYLELCTQTSALPALPVYRLSNDVEMASRHHLTLKNKVQQQHKRHSNVNHWIIMRLCDANCKTYSKQQRQQHSIAPHINVVAQ